MPAIRTQYFGQPNALGRGGGDAFEWDQASWQSPLSGTESPSSSPSPFSSAPSPLPETSSPASPSAPVILPELDYEYLTRLAGPKPTSRRRSPSHISRPPNAFLVFRSAFWAHYKTSLGHERRHHSISRLAAEAWNKCPEEQRALYRQYAAIVKDIHSNMYPNYKYLPASSKNKTKAKTKTRTKRVVEDARCKLMADMLWKGMGSDELGEIQDEFEGLAQLPASFDALTIGSYDRFDVPTRPMSSSSTYGSPAPLTPPLQFSALSLDPAPTWNNADLNAYFPPPPEVPKQQYMPPNLFSPCEAFPAVSSNFATVPHPMLSSPLDTNAFQTSAPPSSPPPLSENTLRILGLPRSHPTYIALIEYASSRELARIEGLASAVAPQVTVPTEPPRELEPSPLSFQSFPSFADDSNELPTAGMGLPEFSFEDWLVNDEEL